MKGGKVIKVSVIVPVYNSARYLPKSLESILEQTLTDIEVICVDDCSTDGSLEYIESIHDPRLRVVNLPGNKGAGVARNTGMDVASGEYIYFMDSDDWIDRDYLEVLSKVADSENRNIVLNTNFKREYKEGESGLAVRHDPKEGLLAPGRYPASTAQAYAFPSLWIRLYRRKFLIDNDIRFPETLRRSEDVYFTSLAGLLESEAFVIQGPCYHYLQRESSLSASRDVKGFLIRNRMAPFQSIMNPFPICFSCDKKNSGRFQDDLRELVDEGITVIFVIPPMHESLVFAHGEKQKMVDYFKSVAEERKIPFLDYSEMFRSDSTKFNDETHLNLIGARSFSDSLANDILRLGLL